jgi:MinD-like ATPase involved in chromosome partitioning or flagellar assembly
MHCLLCHEKIPRLRHWRTKSEFCCDEHAALHRRQTLERLVGSDSGAESSPVDAQERIAALAERSSASKQAAALFDPRPESCPAEPTAGEGAPARPMQDAGMEDAASAEPTWQAEQDPFEAAAETEWSGHETESPELDEGIDEQELIEEHASVQHDEPFPIEIGPLESRDSGPSGTDISEPVEPALFEGPPSSELTNLSPLESSLGAKTREEAEDPGLQSSMPEEPQAVAEAGEPEPGGETAETQGEDLERPIEAGEASPSPDGLDLSLLDDEMPEAADVLEAAAELAELTAEAEPPAPAEPEVSAAEPAVPAGATAEQAAATVAESSSQKTAKSQPGGPDFQLKKPSDRQRSRGGKKAAAGAGNEESLNRLAGQLVDRDSKLRAMGPGSEARREGKSKLVCFLPVQGGNGSSTVSLHVAEAISHHLNKRVLLADFDFHSGTLAFRLGLKPEHTFVDVFKWEQPETGAWDKVVCPWKQLDVLVAPPSNASIRPQSMDRLPDIFMSALRRYPYVVVDHPDAIYSSSRHILTMSDLVYLVCTPEITSLHLARRKVQQIRAMGVPGERLRLIVNRTGSWGSLGLEDVGKIAGVPVSWALMNDYAALRDAVWNGGLVQEGSGLARQLRELGWSIMGVDAQVAEESAAPADVVSHV